MRYRIAKSGPAFICEVIGPYGGVAITDGKGKLIQFPTAEAARAEFMRRINLYVNGSKNEKKLDSLEEVT